MIKILAAFFTLHMSAVAVSAEVLVASRMIRPGELLTLSDLHSFNSNVPGAMQPGDTYSGLEARVTLFAGQPVSKNDLVPPRLVKRNELILLEYRNGGLVIFTDGRSLSEGSLGDLVQVMNLSSKTKLTGRVSQNGTVVVSNSRN